MIYKNVVCPFCGCLCDDIEVEVENGKITGVKNGCIICKSKFLNHDKNRVRNPLLRKGGEFIEVGFEEAIDKAAEVLKDASYPLIYGLSHTECGAQRKAIELAELIGGTIDNTTSVCHGSTLTADHLIGSVKCTLGEVKNRADLIIYWGCNPTEAHIRHTSRYSMFPVGLYTEAGRKSRHVIAVDVRETPSSKIADIFVKVKPNEDFELISMLRAAINGLDVKDVSGVSSDQIKRLAQKMKESRFGVLFFGLGLTQTMGKHMNLDAVLSFVRDLNRYTKFVLIPMRGCFNVTGAVATSLWQTGYPHSVNFLRGYPRYNPGEFSAVDILARAECDAALIIAADPIASFPIGASRHLAKIPTIVIDARISMTTLCAEVVLPAAMAGIECGGTAYRMDAVPIRLRKVIESKSPSDEEILGKIIERVKAT